MTERLILKWGTLKGWDNLGCMSRKIAQRYAELGMSKSAMLQRDTPEQKKILCELIDAIDGEIWHEWENTAMTKEAAKAYVMDYNFIAQKQHDR